jgi:cellulose synthase operon protein C
MASGLLRATLVYACLLLAACTAATPQELLSQARAAVSAGEVRTAEIHLKNLLQREPKNAEARQLLGSVLLGVGDLGGAEQNLKMALDLGATADVELPLLNALVAQLKFSEALEFIDSRRLPRDQADAAEVAVLQGAAYRGLRRPERAVDVYRAALTTNPRAPDVRTELAATLVGLGQGDEARALVLAILTDEPNYTPALLLRGYLEATSGQRAAAEATLQRVLELERPNAASSPRYGLAMGQLIEVQVALGKIEAADANADALLALNARAPLGRYAKAMVEIQRGDLASAEQRLETLVAEVPDYWLAHRLLGAINIRQNQLGQATMYLRAAVTNNPTDDAARLQLAEVYVRQGDLDAARTLMAGTSVATSDELFLAFAGGASLRAGLPEQASDLFDRSEQQAPTDLQQLVGLSSIYAAAGEFERAIRLLQSSTLQGEQSQQVSDYLLALVQIRQGNLQAADEIAIKLAQQQAQAAWPLNVRGVIALLRADVGGARSFFVKALELDPRNVGTVVNLARVAAAENDPAEAEQYLRQALEIDPAQPAALLGLAQFAIQRRDFVTARTLLDRAPESTARLRSQAGLLALEGQVDAAAQMFAQLFALEPSEATALRAYEAARRAGRPDADAQLLQWHATRPDAGATNFVLGGLAIEKNDLDAALRHYEAVIASHPGHAATLNNLAWLYGERKDPRAIEIGERALAADPNNPSIADTLGWLHVQNGDAARGLPFLAEAAAALPGQREVQYHWAAGLADAGDSARAIEILQRLTADGAEFGSRADAERRLSELRRRAP